MRGAGLEAIAGCVAQGQASGAHRFRKLFPNLLAGKREISALDTLRKETSPQLSRHGRDLDGESKVLQTVDESQNVLAFCAVVEVVRAEVLGRGCRF